MMWSSLHWVQCGCAGLMSHRCDIDKELQGKSQGMWQSVADRVSSLLKIKGCIILSIIANSANSQCNAFQVIQGFFLKSIVGRIIICHMNHLWSPVPGPG